MSKKVKEQFFFLNKSICVGIWPGFVSKDNKHTDATAFHSGVELES